MKMTDLRKAAEDLLEVVEAAIKAGDWKVDGACDQDSAIVRLRQALAQPEQKGHCTCGDPKALGVVHFRTRPCFHYTAPPKREWVGLTQDDKNELFNNWWNKNQSFNKLIEDTEEKLMEKNNG